MSAPSTSTRTPPDSLIKAKNDLEKARNKDDLANTFALVVIIIAILAFFTLTILFV